VQGGRHLRRTDRRVPTGGCRAAKARSPLSGRPRSGR
jgi:hypothetical protein